MVARRRPRVETVALAVVFGSTAAGVAQAAGLYGSLVVDGQLPRAEMVIELRCDQPPVRSGKVERSGAWRIGVDGRAKECVVQIEGAQAPVVVYATPTRYDFALSHRNGQAVLTPR